MTLVKKKNSALIKLVDDSRVSALLEAGFEVLEVPAQKTSAENKKPDQTNKGAKK